MKRKTWLVLVLALLAMVLMTGCVPGDGSATPEDPAGFFWGILLKKILLVREIS